MAIDREKLRDFGETALKVTTGTAIAIATFAHPAAALVAPVFQEALGLTLTRLARHRTDKLMDTLSQRVENIEAVRLDERFNDEKFLDLFLDGVQQAQRAITDERIQYIASLLGRCLTAEELDHIKAKRMLTLLGDLDDIEVLYLKSYRERGQFRQEFWEQAGSYFPRSTPLGSPPEKVERKVLLESIQEHLIQLQLLKGRDTETSTYGGQRKVTRNGFEITYLGNLLVRFIDAEIAAQGTADLTSDS